MLKFNKKKPQKNTENLKKKHKNLQYGVSKFSGIFPPKSYTILQNDLGRGECQNMAKKLIT